MNLAPPILALSSVALLAGAGPAPPAASVDQVIAAKQDLWGEAALRQPGGPSYEFFRDRLPPLRYVDASFRHYPITLSAPWAPVKARLVSNGSALNALARQPNWRGEAGVPVTFSVGHGEYPFGADLALLDGPKYAGGWLPIVQLRYRQAGGVYTQEAFAAVEPELARHGVVYLRFGLESGGKPEGGARRVTLHFEGSEPWANREGAVRDARGNRLAVYEPRWQWNAARNTLTADLKAGETAVLAVATQPLPDEREKGREQERASPVRSSLSPFPPLSLSSAAYDAARELTKDRWAALLAPGTEVETPEPVVNHAWRSLLAGSYALLAGDEIRYSQGNQYAKLYVGEGTDALRSFLLWGHGDAARRMLPPVYDYTRKGLEFHQAAFKLQTLAHLYWVTRDAEFLRAQRPRWEKELNVILNGIEPQSGLLPREKYCGDIETLVYSLNSNANCWRALRDMGAALEDAGEREWPGRLRGRASAFRKTVLAAAEKSIRRDVSPAFVPIALFGEEQPPDPITATRIGSYWNIMVPYVLGSGIFRYDSPQATELVRYLQEKGGLCMGMPRSQPNAGSFWVEPANINQLYGLRYTMALLQRDEPDRALVTFYGLLAQGFTRDTFIGAEGTAIRPLDRFGRQMYLPPNSAANGHFLWALRNLLVHDADLDNDGRPESLRLLHATPRRWLADGARLRVRRAATAFGPVSAEVTSRLSRSEVIAELDLPARPAQHASVRLRLPAGWRLASAEAAGTVLDALNAETVSLRGLTGHLTIRAKVVKAR